MCRLFQEAAKICAEGVSFEGIFRPVVYLHIDGFLTDRSCEQRQSESKLAKFNPFPISKPQKPPPGIHPINTSLKDQLIDVCTMGLLSTRLV